MVKEIQSARKATCLLNLRFAGNGGGHHSGRGLVHSPRGLLKLGQIEAALVSFHLPGQRTLMFSSTRRSEDGRYQAHLVALSHHQLSPPGHQSASQGHCFLWDQPRHVEGKVTLAYRLGCPTLQLAQLPAGTRLCGGKPGILRDAGGTKNIHGVKLCFTGEESLVSSSA